MRPSTLNREQHTKKKILLGSPARYEIGFRNALALEIVFRRTIAIYCYSGAIVQDSRNTISRTSVFQNAILEQVVDCLYLEMTAAVD